jgi:hypothetical protein
MIVLMLVDGEYVLDTLQCYFILTVHDALQSFLYLNIYPSFSLDVYVEIRA